jgi:hypothetical protein
MCGSREPFDGRLKPLLGHATGASRVWPLDRVIQAWARGTVPDFKDREPGTRALELLVARLEEVAVRAAAGQASPLLAAPTHRGGWIDPRVLAVRLAALEAPPGRFDLAQALHRLPRGADPPVAVTPATRYRFRAGVAPEWQRNVLVVRPLPSPSDAPADEPSEWIPALLTAKGRGRDWALNGPLVRYAWPAGTEEYFAVAALRQFSYEERCPLLDADWMEPLLDARTRAGPMACLALVMAFGVWEKGRTVVAQDALHAAIADGRLHPIRLGGALGWLVAEGLAPVKRLGAAFASAATQSALSAEAVRHVLEVAVAQFGEDPPRDAHALLEPLNELCEAAGAGVADPAARDVLERLAARSSKAGRIARALLDREGRSTHEAAAARDALAVRVARGERWAALS